MGMIQSRKSQWLVNIANQEMSYFEIFYCQKLKQGIYWPLAVRGLMVIQWQVIQPKSSTSGGFVEDGQAKLVARRETYEDMTTLDC